MKPYGQKCVAVLGCDVADILEHGYKAAIGGKDYFKGKRTLKHRARRRWKRIARREALS